MASRALMHRLSSAFSSWLASTRVGHRPDAVTTVTWIAGPTVRPTSSCSPATRRLASTGFGSSVWRREKASRRWVSAGGALGRALGGGDVAPGLGTAALRHAGLQHLQPAGDAGQQVVEIMGQAAGELADRLHLLALAQRVLETAAVGHVAADGEKHAALRHRRPVERPQAAVLGQQPHVERPHGPAGGQLRQRGPRGGDVGRVAEFVEAAAHQVLGRIAEHVGPGRVDVAVHPVQATHHQQVHAAAPDQVTFAGPRRHPRFQVVVHAAQHLVDPAQLGLARGQPVLRRGTLRLVLRHADDAVDLAGRRIGHRPGAIPDAAFAAIGPHDAVVLLGRLAVGLPGHGGEHARPVLRVDAVQEAVVVHVQLLRRPAPDLAVGGADVVEGAGAGIDDVEHLAHGVRQLAQPLLADGQRAATIGQLGRQGGVGSLQRHEPFALGHPAHPTCSPATGCVSRSIAAGIEHGRGSSDIVPPPWRRSRPGQPCPRRPATGDRAASALCLAGGPGNVARDPSWSRCP